MSRVQGREEAQTKRNAEMAAPVTELNSKQEAMQKMTSECWAQSDSALLPKGMRLTLERETTLGNKALTMVRRAALRYLLEQEQKQYAMELGLIGKAFYRQRI